MGTRASSYLLPTLKNDPADAEAVSHRLLVRGGFVRQVGAGLYTYLPLGWRVMQRIAAVIRSEMDTIAMEVSMPVLQPASLWQDTGRYAIPELFKLVDNSNRPYVLAMTHEEAFTYHAARELRSYRDLPQVWYQIQLKERDEPRPKSGIVRTREFLMKDSYSFDRDSEALDVAYRRHIDVYRRIYDRCGLRYWMVESDTGMMGGEGAHEFMAPSPAGEDELVLCSNNDYAANLEVARSLARAPVFGPPLDQPQEVETPGIETIDQLADFLGVDAAATAKAMPVVVGDEVVLALVRGDDRLHEMKLQKALRADYRPATPDEIRATFGADPGSIGPAGVDVRVIADETLREGQFVGGANRTGYHLRGLEAGRDFHAAFHDLRVVVDGDHCPVCGTGTLRVERAIEIGNIFKLGTKYSEPLGATYLDDAGKEHPIVMGSYGIGLARIMAAAVEQGHDEHGIIWPPPLAPFDAHLVVIGGEGDPQVAVAGEIERTLDADGRSVLVDDRDLGPGARFADAELIGAPVRITVGKRTASDGTVDVQTRNGRSQVTVATADVSEAVERALQGVKGGADGEDDDEARHHAVRSGPREADA